MTNGYNIFGDGTTIYLRGSGGDDSFTGSSISEAFFTGMGDDHVFAGAGGDRVYADIGNDWFDGWTGIDTLDFSLINNIDADSAVENDVYRVVFDLAKTVNNLGYLGTKTTYGFESVRGSFTHDKLWGTSGENTLDAIDGNDLLDGRGGADISRAERVRTR